MISCRDLLCLVQRGAGLLFTLGGVCYMIQAMSLQLLPIKSVEYLTGYVLPAVTHTLIGLILLLSARRVSGWFYPDGGKNGNPKVIAEIDERALYRLGCRLLGVSCLFVVVLPGPGDYGWLFGQIGYYWNEGATIAVGLAGAAVLILPGSAWHQSCRHRAQRLFTWWRSWPEWWRSWSEWWHSWPKWWRSIIDQRPMISADDTTPTSEGDVTMGSEDETT